MSQNVQDDFLNNIRQNKISVTVFLVNGVKLQGLITWFDSFSFAVAPRRTYSADLQTRHFYHYAQRGCRSGNQ